MDNELQYDIIKDVKKDLTETEAQVIWYLRKNQDKRVVVILRNALKNLYDKNNDGMVRVFAKYSLTPEEAKFLESIKDLSGDKLQNLKEFMEKLLEEG